MSLHGTAQDVHAPLLQLILVRKSECPLQCICLDWDIGKIPLRQGQLPLLATLAC